MKFGVLLLPRYPHTQRMIVKQLAELDHSFVVIESRERGKLGGGLVDLEPPSNVEIVRIDDAGDPSAPPPTELPERHHAELVELVRRHGIEQVVSFSDRGVVAAARLRQELGMGGNTVATERSIVDKEATRRVLHASGLSRIAFKASSVDTLVEDAHGFPLPAIVKPTNLSASLCVELIRSPDGFARFADRCRANKVFGRGKVVIEEYMPGREFSVEGIVVGADVAFFGITESHTSGEPYFVGTGHDFVARHPEAPAVYAFVRDVIRCLGLTSCPFHIELKATDHGHEVVEAHSRFAGAMIMELVASATGIRPFADYLETLAGAPFRGVRAERSIYSQHLFCAREGVITNLELTRSVFQDERVVSYSIDGTAGDVIEAGVLPLEYVGYINFRTESLDEAQRFRALAAAALTVAQSPS